VFILTQCFHYQPRWWWVSKTLPREQSSTRKQAGKTQVKSLRKRNTKFSHVGSLFQCWRMEIAYLDFYLWFFCHMQNIKYSVTVTTSWFISAVLCPAHVFPWRFTHFVGMIINLSINLETILYFSNYFHVRVFF